MSDAHAAAIGFQITGIKVNSFTINEELLSPGSDIGFGLGLQHQFFTDLSEHVVQIHLNAGYNDQQDRPVVAMHIDCQYQLTGYQEWLETLGEEQSHLGILPQELAWTLNSISISTTRGVLFERLRGTALQQIVLPVIDPTAFQPVI